MITFIKLWALTGIITFLVINWKELGKHSPEATLFSLGKCIMKGPWIMIRFLFVLTLLDIRKRISRAILKSYIRVTEANIHKYSPEEKEIAETTLIKAKKALQDEEQYRNY